LNPVICFTAKDALDMDFGLENKDLHRKGRHMKANKERFKK